MSTESTYSEQRLPTTYHRQIVQERGRPVSESRLPTNSSLRQMRHPLQSNEMALQTVKQEDGDVASPAIDRRTRRYKQAVIEGEKNKRTQEGKKAYYLTLDSEGKPCGPGKKAWLSDLNKLASWLDPSCLHIKKQTYEDMCIFKDRLNENFEYSGDLNEDYLRSLAGKAVTRKRTELIALIERDGSRPPNVDSEKWERLQKIAESKQRAEKKDNGRYANSCRKTLGRTGALGVEGTRERLRDLFGRSPDPHELRDEMEHDKGFGGRKEGRPPRLQRPGKECANDVWEVETMHTRRHTSGSEDYDIEEAKYARHTVVRRGAMEVCYEH